MWNKVLGRVAPKCLFVQKRAHWWALCNMLLGKRLTRLFKSTFLDSTYSNFPLFMSCTETLWCTNSKCFFPLTFLQYPTIPKEVCNPSSLNLLHEISCPIRGHSSQPKQSSIFLLNTGKLLKFPLTITWKCLWVKAPPCSIEYKSTMHPSSRNFLKLTRSAMPMSIPETAIVTDASKYFKGRMTYFLSLKRARALSSLEPWYKIKNAKIEKINSDVTTWGTIHQIWYLVWIIIWIYMMLYFFTFQINFYQVNLWMF